MRKTKTNLQSKAKKIKLLLLDVDGVLTDGRIILDNQGNELKAFHVRDGHGIVMAQRAGIIVGIITGRKAEVVNIRARELGIQEVHQGTHEKIRSWKNTDCVTVMLHIWEMMSWIWTFSSARDLP
jgi:3-deoxy-D-manno-octulosonate 8-phosphate phosphatase (KDO 8-P phosphatase)